MNFKKSIMAAILTAGIGIAATATPASAALYSDAILENKGKSYSFESGEEKVISGTAYLNFKFDDAEAGEKIRIYQFNKGRLIGFKTITKQAGKPCSIKMNVSANGEHKFIIYAYGVQQHFFLFNK